MLRNRYTIPLFVALITTISPLMAQAEVKIAVVDIQRAIAGTDDGRKAKRKLKQLFEERQETLDSKQKALKEMKDELERQRDVLSQDALQKKLEGYQQAMAELQGIYVEYQRELGAQEGELTQHIVERMQEILRRMGQTQGYTMILEAGEAGVIWVPSNLDLTDELIQRYSAKYGKRSKGGSQ